MLNLQRVYSCSIQNTYAVEEVSSSRKAFILGDIRQRGSIPISICSPPSRPTKITLKMQRKYHSNIYFSITLYCIYTYSTIEVLCDFWGACRGCIKQQISKSILTYLIATYGCYSIIFNDRFHSCEFCFVALEFGLLTSPKSADFVTEGTLHFIYLC